MNSRARFSRKAPSRRWPITLLDVYVAKEMAAPLLFGVGAFSSLFASADLLNLANIVVEAGAPIVPAVKVFLLKLPQIIVWTLPMSVLLGTLLSLSKLSANSEIVAMRAGGMSMLRIALPIVVVAVMVSGLSFAISETVVPGANAASRRILTEEVRGRTLPTVSRHVVVKQEKGSDLEWLLYANRYDGRQSTFHNATMVGMENNRPVQTTFADRIIWLDDAWVMENGIVYVYGDGDEMLVATYPEHTRQIDLGHGPDDIARLQKDPEEMGLAELRGHIETLKSQGSDVRPLQVQMYMKYSIPFAGIVFAVVGLPLGIQSHRSASSIGFGLSIIIIFVYYVLMSIGSALGQSGALPPLLAAWMQNGLLGAYGLRLWWRAAR